MTKQVFLDELQARLSGLPQQDVEERLGFYGEMIDDRMEEGVPEDAAVAELGSVEEVVEQILDGYPLSKLVKERVKPGRGLRAWEIALLILGAPLWLPLLIAAFAVLLSIYLVIWSVGFSLWAVCGSAALSSISAVVIAVMYAAQGRLPAGGVMLGAGLFAAGCFIRTLFGSIAATRGIVTKKKKLFSGFKSRLIGKERVK